MLVKLYGQEFPSQQRELEGRGVRILRPLALDKRRVCDFVARAFDNPGWVAECEAALLRQPASCYIAVVGGEVVGFACFDATAKGMLGPIGVSEAHRGQGIAAELIRQCLLAMRAEGYAYAVIGWVSSEAFYTRVCGAVTIPDSAPGIYARMVVPPPVAPG